MTVKVAIAGAAGRMGQTLIRCLHSPAGEGMELCGTFDQPGHPRLGQAADPAHGGTVRICESFEEAVKEADVLIDFSAPVATAEIAGQSAARPLPLVVGTTGLQPKQIKTLQAASELTPVVFAANMSLGINLLLDLVQRAAEALRDKGFDLEIIERHHRLKKDAPSGTALALGEAAAEALHRDLLRDARHGREGLAGERTREEIGFHAIRGGDIIGEHTVLFAGEGETVELRHAATSRDTFALGALRAAQWVVSRKPGLYSMRHVLGLE